MVGKPAALWLGFVVFWYALRWQPTQSRGVPLYTPPLWHALQAALECRPTSEYVECEKTPWLHEVSDALWQVVHVVEKPTVLWFGLLVDWYALR